MVNKYKFLIYEILAFPVKAEQMLKFKNRSVNFLTLKMTPNFRGRRFFTSTILYLLF